MLLVVQRSLNFRLNSIIVALYRLGLLIVATRYANFTIALDQILLIILQLALLVSNLALLSLSLLELSSLLTLALLLSSPKLLLLTLALSLPSLLLLLIIIKLSLSRLSSLLLLSRLVELYNRLGLEALVLQPQAPYNTEIARTC